MRKFITLFVSALLPILAAGQPTDGVSWTASMEPDGKGGSIIRILGRSDKPLSQIHGTLEWQSCLSDRCFSPRDTIFSADSAGSGATPSKRLASLDPTTGFAGGSPSSGAEGGTVSQEFSPAGGESASRSNFKLLLEAILWGLAMLLTPCVFPMVPMTVSFFLKGSENRRRGRFRAIMYGVFIVAIYTLPIVVVIAATEFFGGDAITADIFNTIATHWLPNILFFVIFMVFAASFFGAFEFRLPSSWVNGADRKSDGKGLGGVFFMALTLVLVSFSCTGPIVGTVLIKSVQGSVMTPVAVMLAFSTAFALPFVIFALFPTLMQKLPKSGSWLGRVKIVLGFIELALGLKFLSVADQAYHWGILGREIYLGLWIAIFTLLGLYLAGVIRFKGEEKISGFSFGRLSLVIIDFAFVLYLVQGLWGAPLTALSGYLPPREDIVSSGGSPSSGARGGTVSEAASEAVSPSGAPSRKRLASLDPTTGFAGGPPSSGAEGGTVFGTDSGGGNPEALVAGAREMAARTGRNVFLQVSGYACVNCREMEARVLSDSRVAEKLRNAFVTVVLYVDDKTKLPQEQWVTTESGKVLKQVGKINSYYVMRNFEINSQPSYVLLDPDGKLLKPVRGYNLSVNDFLDFLDIR